MKAGYRRSNSGGDYDVYVVGVWKRQERRLEK